MSSRSQRRRDRAARVTPSPETARRRLPSLPLLPLVAAASGAALLAAAWTTTWAPGPGLAADLQNRFTLEIAEPQQATINNWERFFICYDLLDPAIIDLTLRSAQRANGSLEFPSGGRVEVVLPTAQGPGNETQAPGASEGEDELIAARQAILGAAVPARMAQVRQQCARAAPAA